MADDSLLVDEDAGGNDRVAKRSAQRVGGIHCDWEGRAGALDPGLGSRGPLGVSGDGQKVDVEVSFMPLLPHGQLLAARSPRRPHEHDVSASLVASEVDWGPVDTREDDAGNRSARSHARHASVLVSRSPKV